jgi:hypothetical protein
MRNRYRTSALAIALACFSAAIAASAQQRETVPPPPGVQLQLVITGGKTTFRLGEPIDLELRVWGENPQYVLHPKDAEETCDRIVAAPEPGAFRWNGTDCNGVIEEEPLTQAGTTFLYRLNDQIEIREPGTYTAWVVTAHIMKRPSTPSEFDAAIPIQSNAVTFQVVAVSEKDEAARVAELDSKIMNAATSRDSQQASNELAYLIGDAAAREKVRLYLAAQNDELLPIPGSEGGRTGYIGYALAFSRNKKLEIDLLHKAWLDPRKVPNLDLLDRMTELARLDAGIGNADSGAMAARPDRWTEEQPYLDEIVATMPRRTGQNRVDTAHYLYSKLAAHRSLDDPAFAQIRAIEIDSFESFPDNRLTMLRYGWDGPGGLKDPRIPVLERILAERVDPDSDEADDLEVLRTIALNRLIELAPQVAEPYVVAELKRPDSNARLEFVGGLPEKMLPELDQPLLQQIQARAVDAAVPRSSFKSSPDLIEWDENISLLESKAWIAARYASPAIWEQVLLVYHRLLPRDDTTASAGDALATYLLRWRPAETLPLLRATGGPDLFENESALYGNLSQIYRQIGEPYPAEVRVYLLDEVAHGTWNQVGHAAMHLALHGLPDDQAAVKKRLATIQASLHDTPDQLNAKKAADAELQLVEALKCFPIPLTPTASR